MWFFKKILYNKKYIFTVILLVLIFYNIWQYYKITNLRHREYKLITDMKNMQYNHCNYILIYNDSKNHSITPNWKDFFPSPQNTTLIGKEPDYIKGTLGNPYIILKKLLDNKINTQELWIYMPNISGNDLDNTGIYLTFKNYKLSEYRIDDFNGIIEKNLGGYFK